VGKEVSCCQRVTVAASARYSVGRFGSTQISVLLKQPSWNERFLRHSNGIIAASEFVQYRMWYEDDNGAWIGENSDYHNPQCWCRGNALDPIIGRRWLRISSAIPALLTEVLFWGRGLSSVPPCKCRNNAPNMLWPHISTSFSNSAFNCLPNVCTENVSRSSQRNATVYFSGGRPWSEWLAIQPRFEVSSVGIQIRIITATSTDRFNARTLAEVSLLSIPE
jgi:hypothetical protein